MATKKARKWTVICGCGWSAGKLANYASARKWAKYHREGSVGVLKAGPHEVAVRPVDA